MNKQIKNNMLSALLLAIVGTACSVAPVGQSSADVIDAVMNEFAQLEKRGSKDGQDWLNLAQKARRSGRLDIAERALARAENLEFSPVGVALEKARLKVAANDSAAAVAALQSAMDAGFTSVGALVQDPAINGLAGQAAYDALIDAMSVLAYPCQHEAGFRDFDFWVGEWDVAVANGTQVGTNSIQPAQRGCVLIENWTNSAGGTGMSVNYLDKSTDEWVQIWSAEGGSQINIRGGLTDEGMLLEGYLHTIGAGTTVPFRGRWTLLPDGRVRQYFEQSNDDGVTWVPWFEGFYTRRPETNASN
jgi:hypothetical protein